MPNDSPYCHPEGARPDECGICWKWVNEPDYRAHIDRVPPARPELVGIARRTATAGGPGTETMAILTSLGSKPCGLCYEYAREMNRWGVEGCRLRRGEIVAHLEAERQQRGWLEMAKAAALAVAKAMTFIDPLDVLGSIVDEAIRRAEAKASAPTLARRGSLVRVPEPPLLDLTPTSSRAVVTVVVGPEGEALWEISGPLMQVYAAELGADLVVLDWPGNPEWPMSCKFGIARALDHYEQIVYADADVLFRPGCLDLFNAYYPEEVGGVNDMPHVLRTDPTFFAEFQRVRESQGMRRAAVPYYLNTGLLVLSQQHRDLLAVPARPIPALHCSEQHVINARMHDAGTKVRLLPAECNWQGWPGDWPDDDFASPPPPEAVLHFSGWKTGFEKRLEAMRRWVGR